MTPMSTPVSATAQGLPRDSSGFAYLVDEYVGPFRVTDCCGAAVTFHDTTLCCKGCWVEVDLAYLAAPTIAGGC